MNLQIVRPKFHQKKSEEKIPKIDDKEGENDDIVTNDKKNNEIMLARLKLKVIKTQSKRSLSSNSTTQM